jgi:hypothetical protein
MNIYDLLKAREIVSQLECSISDTIDELEDLGLFHLANGIESDYISFVDDFRTTWDKVPINGYCISAFVVKKVSDTEGQIMLKDHPEIKTPLSYFKPNTIVYAFPNFEQDYGDNSENEDD